MDNTADQDNNSAQKSLQIEKTKKKEANKNQIRILKAVKSISMTKNTSKTRAMKPKSKYTLRLAQKKVSKVSANKKTIPELPVYIPRKIFHIVSLLRNERFYKLVAKFFKPNAEIPAWKFSKQSTKKSVTGKPS
ncbi:uncharacterized protein LOC141534743 isoform X1 [Cotesia typhae]|uniref:uncharacterized protein LOC141534743 isoform X1 n=1 Tax=Cotesia typhae TaxID=2053667 RepID=UPI003D69F3F5